MKETEECCKCEQALTLSDQLAGTFRIFTANPVTTAIRYGMLLRSKEAAIQLVDDPLCDPRQLNRKHLGHADKWAMIAVNCADGFAGEIVLHGSLQR
jgi:hypothetical protein